MILSESKFLVMSLVGAAKESESFCLGFLGVLVFLKGLEGGTRAYRGLRVDFGRGLVFEISDFSGFSALNE